MLLIKCIFFIPDMSIGRTAIPTSSSGRYLSRSITASVFKTKVFSSASAVPSSQHASPSLFCFLKFLLFSLILPRLTQSVSHFQNKRSHTLDTHIFLYVSSLMSKCSYISIFGKSTTQFPDVTNKVDGSRCSLLGKV